MSFSSSLNDLYVLEVNAAVIISNDAGSGHILNGEALGIDRYGVSECTVIVITYDLNGTDGDGLGIALVIRCALNGNRASARDLKSLNIRSIKAQGDVCSGYSQAVERFTD